MDAGDEADVERLSPPVERFGGLIFLRQCRHLGRRYRHFRHDGGIVDGAAREPDRPGPRDRASVGPRIVERAAGHYLHRERGGAASARAGRPIW